MLEKNTYLGGNAAKASSVINACCFDDEGGIGGDGDVDGERNTFDLFLSDTVRSASTLARPSLIDPLISHSASAVKWLRDRTGADLSEVGLMGGHSRPRTYRPGRRSPTCSPRRRTAAVYRRAPSGEDPRKNHHRGGE